MQIRKKENADAEQECRKKGSQEEMQRKYRRRIEMDSWLCARFSG